MSILTTRAQLSAAGLHAKNPPLPVHISLVSSPAMTWCTIGGAKAEFLWSRARETGQPPRFDSAVESGTRTSCFQWRRFLGLEAIATLKAAPVRITEVRR